jgi:uncharacterized repeat protein (TIGR02543 family)
VITYVISYELNNGVNSDENPATYTVEDVVVLQNPSKTGYDFTGWAEGTGIAKGSIGDKTFTAQWSAINYAINYELSGGVNHSDNPATYTVEDFVALQNPSRTGYDFNGWDEGNEIAVGSTGDKIFTAQWSVINYTINYELNGGVNSDENSATYTVEDVIVLQNPSRTGYDFAGWAEGDSIKIGSTGDKTFTAQWSVITYVISYELNNGVNSDENPATYTVEDVVTLQNPSKTGYDFTGWAEGTGIAKGSTGDKTFTAQWSAINYAINYELNGGANNDKNPATYTIEDRVELQDPTREGCNFTGWNEASVITIGSTGDRTFTALWQCTEAKIEEIVIDNIVISVDSIASTEEETILEYIVQDCEQTSLTLDLIPSADATVTVNGTAYDTGVEIDFTENSVTTVDIKVESQAGDKEQSYKLNISAPLKDERLYYQRWSDVIAINRNPATNGGHNISEVQWYKHDGTQSGNGEFIVIDDTDDINDYYTEVTVTTGDNIETVHKVCATVETKSVKKIVVYPNPVPRGEKITIDIPETFVGSALNIYNIKGLLVKSRQSLPAKSNSIDISELASGIYLLQITGKDGNRETVTIIVN